MPWISGKQGTDVLNPMHNSICNNYTLPFHYRLDLLYIKGKRGNKCPILLAKDTKKAIEVLIAKQDDVGVNKDNQFIFAAPTRKLYL